jgi:archaellum component FlaD/FlaE
MNKTLEMLAEEFNAAKTIADVANAHAAELLNEYIDLAFEQAAIEAFNELTPDEQMALIVGLLCEQVEDNIVEELTAVVDAIEKAAEEEEMRRYEEERKREFFAELEMLSGMHRCVVTPEPEPTFLEVGLPEDVLKHLKRLGVKF